MNNGFQLFIDTAPAAAVFAIGCIVLLIPRMKETAVRSLVIYLLLVIFLLITNISELVATTEHETILFAKLQYIPFVYIPVVWLSFCLRFTGWLTKTNRTLIMSAILFPLMLFIPVITNEMHHLVWTELRFVYVGEYSVLRPQHGPIFWILAIYNWCFIGMGTLLVLRSFFTGQSIFYRQSLWIVAGVLLPGISNFINLSGILTWLEKDFTPIGYALSGICFVLGMYFHRLFWVMPVARSIIVENLTIGILVLDRHGWIVDHNERIDHLLNLPQNAAGLSYINFPRLFRLMFAGRIFDDWPANASGEGQMEIDGLTLSWTAHPSASDARGVIITVDDISEKIRLQTEMELIKNEFVSREKLATIGRITAGLAHEINNPLAYIKSDARSLSKMIEKKCREVMGDREPDDEMKEIHAIHQALYSGLERIEGLVGSLLAFSRQGTIESKNEPFDLNECIETTIGFVRHELKRTIDIRYIRTPLPPVKGDKGEMNQVLFNLISNAAQAIRERAVRERTDWEGIITIHTLADGNAVYCDVQNNGNPINDEVKDRMFDLFFTTKKEKWGTGLGLNLSREIIEKHHGGALYLFSQDPVIFRIELPLEGA